MGNNEYVNTIPVSNQMKRLLWNVVYVFLFFPFPTKIFRSWRNFILRLFGAKIHSRAGVYSSVRIWAPWNLTMGDNAWLGPRVNCYNVDRITIQKDATVSQDVHLCSASHNVFSKKHELITAPIVVESNSWIAVDAYIHMGVTVGEGSVVGANACVYKDVAPWTIVGGNPAQFIKNRIITDA